MKVIAQKDNTYTFHQFVDNSVKQDYLNGIYFDVIETKDGEIILFNPVLSNDASIKNIQNTPYESLVKTEIITLEELLKHLNEMWKKRVFLNLVPFITPPINEKNLAEITTRNEKYVTKVISLLKKYGEVDVRVSTESISLLYFLRKQLALSKLGIVLDPQSLGYIDVDFYVVKPLMFDVKILEEQLKKGKEIIFQLTSLYDINFMVSKEFEEDLKECIKEDEELQNRVTFLSPYPELIYRTFQNKT